MKYKNARHVALGMAVLFLGAAACLSVSGGCLAAQPGGGSAKDASASVSRLKPVKTHEFLDKLASCSGKVVLVNFFAAYCGPCRREIPELVQLRKDVSPEDLVIMGVAIDDNIKDAEKFVKKMGIADAYPVFYGGEELSRAYGIDAIPFNVVYSRKGRIEVSEPGYVPPDEMRQFILGLVRR